jgi:hypothetical protein
MRSRCVASLLGVVLTLGCTNTTAPAAKVNGTWIHEYQIPGMGFRMTLSTQGSVVSGSGTWMGEACCSGSVAVSGTVQDAAVTLDMTFTTEQGAPRPPYTEHFVGRVVASDTLSGTLTQSGSSAPYSYRRMAEPR